MLLPFRLQDLEWPQDTLEYKRRKFIEKADRRRSRICRSIGEESSIINVCYLFILNGEMIVLLKKNNAEFRLAILETLYSSLFKKNI